MRKAKCARSQRNVAFPKKAAFLLTVTVLLILLTTGCLNQGRESLRILSNCLSDGLDKELVSRPIDHAKVAELNLSISGESTTISAGLFHTVGLKPDGTVVAVGANEKGQLDVADWRDIIALSTGKNHTKVKS